MSYGEAWRLTHMLLAEPGSQVAAACAGWQYPLSREGLILRDLYDLQHISKVKRKPSSYPAPWDQPSKKIGAGTSVTVPEYKAIRARLAAQHLKPSQPRDALGRFAKTS